MEVDEVTAANYTENNTKGYRPSPNMTIQHQEIRPLLRGSQFEVEMHPETQVAVLVRNACTKYGTQIVLNNFNMTVQRSSIYGLLGSSGSGKTTILTAIVGLRSLDSGQISICGYPTGSIASGVPGKRVGYMPQEIALNGEFLIREVLQYFGRIYGMSPGQIDERCSYLVKLLSLEKCRQTLIRNMSDGQKRRVSLAVTLLHEPEILILDEPTAGCDPLLRQTIWKFLNELVANNRTTVIVTTHYIEETRQADRVGIMRNGHLLVEESPNKLLTQYNAKLLDEIVLKLCQIDEAETIEEPSLGKAVTHTCNWEHPTAENGPADQENLSGTNFGDRLQALMSKNVLILRRNFWFLFFLITMPSLVFFTFNVVITSEPGNLKIGVINDEMVDDPFNATDRSSTCFLQNPPACISLNLSCLYLDSLDKDMIQLVPFKTVKDALQEVKYQRLWGFIKFGSNFSDQMFSMLLLNKRDDTTVEQAQIRIKLDMTSVEIALQLKREFQEAFFRFSKKLLTSCDVDPAGVDLPLIFDTPIYGSTDPPLVEYVGPGMALGVIFFIGGLTCGLTYIIEKKDGMINRTLVTGVKTLEIILSHLIVQFGIMIVQLISNILLLIYAFGVDCQGSVLLVALGILLSSVSGMSLGFLAAIFCEDEKTTLFVAMGTFFPSFLLAGLIWPIEIAPKIVQYISVLMPSTFMAESVRSILLRGFGLSHQVVWIGFLSTLGWICAYWTFTIGFHWIRQRK